MTSNFKYLQSEWPTLYENVVKAESTVRSEPVTSGFYSRLALEEAVRLIYKINYLDIPYNSTIFSLMKMSDFRELVPSGYLEGVENYTRKIGNSASHGKKISASEALTSIKYLYTFLKWFAIQYSEKEPSIPGSFDESIIPDAGEHQKKLKEMQEQIAQLQAEAEEKDKKRIKEIEELREELQSSPLKLQQYKEEKEEQLAVLEEKRQARDFTKVKPEFTEAETRRHLIDAALKEAGWEDLRPEKGLEYRVTGMPITADNPKGNGFVDYLLWDDNGLPLALIEAKRTSLDESNGKHQAWLYANCLEQMHGQRPIIFYTNGYETQFWDDTFYPPRKVYGFYTKEELQWLLKKRKSRKDIRIFPVNNEIAGRWYQKEAIKRVGEAFAKTSPLTKNLTGGQNKVLLVMATGSGKTRTAAALVEVLYKAGWAKRVLFLADRNALVRQAKKNFNEYLPDYTSIDLTKENANDSIRIVFSTYPTMMNQIDNAKKASKRFFGIGHFDLIIVDEAHRSVYNKYKAIFDYFDALLVGLTATPKEDIDHHTFELFECPAGDPTFAYELKKAVEDKFLVPYKRYELSTKFLREGIKYHELSDKEKEKYEETFDDEEILPEEITNAALTQWLFNKDTVNKILRTLMERGIKIEGGDKIGRTIIFAANKKHAKFIVDCFNNLYPEYGGNFIDSVYNDISHVQDIIDKFCDEEKENNPQIAVSVDMMDTGIDAPRVLNLVFFKFVRSYAKFWQMIGRGTRLCPDIFGPQMDKKEFYIFDNCGNFEFFKINPDGTKGSTTKPITQQIFEARLHLSQLLAQTGEEENLELSKVILDNLHKHVLTLDKSRFAVNMNLRYVDTFSKREKWNNLSNEGIHQIKEFIGHLPIPEQVHEMTRRFDLLMLRLQIAKLLSLSKVTTYVNKLKEIAGKLSSKYTIPEVCSKKALIEQMKQEGYYKNLSQKELEEIRKEIRDLLKYMDLEERKFAYSNLQDQDLILEEKEAIYETFRENYRDRVEAFVRENKDNITIRKFHTNNPITPAEIEELERMLFNGDTRGTKEDFIKNFGEQPLGKFIRSIVGLDTTSARKAFSEFLDSGNLTANQIKFLDTIISFLTRNGTIDKGMLAEPPFNEMHDQGIFGIFEDEGQLAKIISIIDSINGNADMTG